MRVKALVAFNAFEFNVSAGQELIIEDKGKRLDLERLGWIEPLEYEVSEVSEDMNVKETKKVTKKVTKKAKE
jgi:hypothetical protein